MTTEHIGIIVTIGIYLLGMVAIGIYCAKKNENEGDFYLGGRKLGPLVTAMSAEASDMSSWLLMGLPGVAYLSGLADPGWTAIGLAVGTYLNWLFVAKRIRVYTHVTDSITLPEFFSNRFRDDKNILRFIAAAVIIIFFIPYTASGFAACGKLFNTMFGVDYHMAMIISAIVIVAYTATGGFLAASTTDLIQSIVMTIALFVVVIFGISVAGGLDVVMENARALPGYLSLTESYSVAENASQPFGFLTAASSFVWAVGYFGMPHVLLRFMAIEDQNKLKTSRRIATVWVVISMTVAVFIGIVGYSMTQVGAIPKLEGSASETIIVEIASLLSQSGTIYVVLAGLIVAGILAATMSTADSQLLAASSSASRDILQGFFKVKMSDKASMTSARITVLIIALIGMFIAKDPNSSVFGIVSFAWAGFGAAFGPVVLSALFWKRSNKQGALAGMVVGGVTVFVWKYLVRPMGGAWNIYELLPAFILAFIAIIVVSLATAPPEKEMIDEYDRVSELIK